MTKADVIDLLGEAAYSDGALHYYAVSKRNDTLDLYFDGNGRLVEVR
ncbi:MAG: hypothetical protein JST16_10890 [Bdellovibrionales bacterium]|nr:hypothetical protein [Bdellovibrionales bacterium]